MLCSSFGPEFVDLMLVYFLPACILFLILTLVMQQSAAFKILRTRLKTASSHGSSTDQAKRSSANAYSQILQVPEVIKSEELGNMHDAINFTSRLHQFEHTQNQHRLHTKLQRQTYNSTSSTILQVCSA